MKIRRRRIEPKDIQKRRVKTHHFNHDMSKIKHYRINTWLFFTVIVHKFEHRDQRRNDGWNKNYPASNTF
ncbi:Uncharacterised protein [Enterobacter ludwigii]|nr:Uncharacterised protein [Enterobacter ludwigii]